MRLADVGWVWEGQGLAPGVHPSIFGVGEGAEFFGLGRSHFMFHPITDLAMKKLGDKAEVVCDISKWLFKDSARGGSDGYVDSRIETVCTEAERVSRLSRHHPNMSGAVFGDMKGLLEREGMSPDVSAAISFSLKMYNSNLKLWSVVYSHELEESCWQFCGPHIEVVNLWVWNRADLPQLDTYIDRARELFPDRPIVLGCYMRDYATPAPMPLEDLSFQWNALVKALADGRVQGYSILGSVLIDSHLRQASWIRDFIKDHS